jgi:hypothetical protein
VFASLLIFVAIMRSQVSLLLMPMARSHLARTSSFVCCLFWMALSHRITQTRWAILEMKICRSLEVPLRLVEGFWRVLRCMVAGVSSPLYDVAGLTGLFPYVPGRVGMRCRMVGWGGHGHWPARNSSRLRSLHALVKVSYMFIFDAVSGVRQSSQAQVTLPRCSFFFITVGVQRCGGNRHRPMRDRWFIVVGGLWYSTFVTLLV